MERSERSGLEKDFGETGIQITGDTVVDKITKECTRWNHGMSPKDFDHLTVCKSRLNLQRLER